MSGTNPAYVVAGLLDKMTSSDSDFRFMAASDLAGELGKDSFVLDESAERRVVGGVLKLVADGNGEVQNMAVRCLGPLVRCAREAQVHVVVDELVKMLSSGTSSTGSSMSSNTNGLRDVAGIGLKTVVAELPHAGGASAAAASVVRRLVPRLLLLLGGSSSGSAGSAGTPSDQTQLDAADILVEILTRFAGALETQKSSSGSSGSSEDLQQNSLAVLAPLLEHTRPAVRKRAIAALGLLAPHLRDDLFAGLVARLAAGTAASPNAKSGGLAKLHAPVALAAALSRSAPARFAPHLASILPHILSFVALNDDDLREQSLIAIESFAMRCPDAVKPFLSDIIAIALEYIKYDPNYDDGTDADGMDTDMDESNADDADADDDENNNDFDDDDEEDYSDDEDMSWKVRRASARLLTSLISTRPEFLPTFYTQVAPALIRRFSEREESVRVDILTTFTAMLAQTAAAVAGSSANHQPISNTAVTGADANPNDATLLISQLSALVPRLVRALIKQIEGKSLSTRSAGFLLLRHLVVVLHDGLGDHLAAILRATELSIAAKGLRTGVADVSVAIISSNSGAGGSSSSSATSTNLKIEALEFLCLLILRHPPSLFYPYADHIVPAVLAAAHDKFYKVSAEALGAAAVLVRTIRPFSIDPATNKATLNPLANPGLAAHVAAIFKTTIERIQVQDASVEVREKAISTLAVLIACAADVLPAGALEQQAVLVLIERLMNEFTRLNVIRALAHIAESPLSEPPASSLAPLAAKMPDILPEVAAQLRKAHRQLRFASLHALAVLVRRFPSPDLYGVILESLCQMLSTDTDLQALPLAVALLDAILQSSPGPDAISAIKSNVVPTLINIVCTTPHIVSGGSALASLVEFWGVLVATGGPGAYSLCVDGLLARVQAADVSREAYPVVAKSIAALSSTGVPEATSLLNQLVINIQNSDPAAVKESTRYLSLLTIGEIGNRCDLSAAVPSLHTILFDLFAAPQEDIKNAAAFALGNVATGNLGLYMPVLIDAVKTQTHQYLSLVALKEAISLSVAAGASGVSALTPFASTIWQLLFEKAETDLEDGARSTLAECLGLLSTADAETFLPRLRDYLAAPKPETRATVVSAIRYTFADHGRSATYDVLLSPLIVEFLRLVRDEDLNVRRVTLGALNSAAHSKPHLIRHSLVELLPLLYQETHVKDELIHIVEMGPFKHKVDKGLDARKAAFECMYTLLDTCLHHIEIFAFVQRVIAGIADPSHDIKVLSHLMVQRLAIVSPMAMAVNLDMCVDALKETLVSKTKNNAVKQEVEKHQELVRAAAKSMVVLARIEGGSSSLSLAGTGAASGASPKFHDLVSEMRGPQSTVLDIVLSMEREVAAAASAPGVGGFRLGAMTHPSLIGSGVSGVMSAGTVPPSSILGGGVYHGSSLLGGMAGHPSDMMA